MADIEALVEIDDLPPLVADDGCALAVKKTVSFDVPPEQEVVAEEFDESQPMDTSDD